MYVKYGIFSVISSIPIDGYLDMVNSYLSQCEWCHNQHGHTGSLRYAELDLSVYTQISEYIYPEVL